MNARLQIAQPEALGLDTKHASGQNVVLRTETPVEHTSPVTPIDHILEPHHAVKREQLPVPAQVKSACCGSCG